MGWSNNYKRQQDLTVALEQIKRDIGIVDYANMIGFTPQRVGKYYTLKEHDSVRINPAENYYWRNSTGTSGSIIDFVMEFEHKDFLQAIKDLSQLVHGSTYIPTIASQVQKETKKEKKELILPIRDDNSKNVIAYLVQTRKIDASIVSDFIVKRLLYQDKEHKNCVFVSRDKEGKPKFACLRASNTKKRFAIDLSGSDYNHCFYIDNQADTLIVSESVIDTMSVMTIMKEAKRNLKNYNYLSLSGTQKLQSVFNHLEEHPNINKLVLALDNDEAGWDANILIKERLRGMNWNGKIIDFIPKEKDWNEELIINQINKSNEFINYKYAIDISNGLMAICDYANHLYICEKPTSKVVDKKYGIMSSDILYSTQNSKVWYALYEPNCDISKFTDSEKNDLDCIRQIQEKYSQIGYYEPTNIAKKTLMGLYTTVLRQKQEQQIDGDSVSILSQYKDFVDILNREKVPEKIQRRVVIEAKLGHFDNQSSAFVVDTIIQQYNVRQQQKELDVIRKYCQTKQYTKKIKITHEQER